MLTILFLSLISIDTLELVRICQWSRRSNPPKRVRNRLLCTPWNYYTTKTAPRVSWYQQTKALFSGFSTWFGWWWSDVSFHFHFLPFQGDIDQCIRTSSPVKCRFLFFISYSFSWFGHLAIWPSLAIFGVILKYFEIKALCVVICFVII